jgi:hypothetical protein
MLVVPHADTARAMGKLTTKPRQMVIAAPPVVSWLAAE